MASPPGAIGLPQLVHVVSESDVACFSAMLILPCCGFLNAGLLYICCACGLVVCFLFSCSCRIGSCSQLLLKD